MNGNIIDTSNELHIYRYMNGVKLVRPEDTSRIQYSPRYRHTNHSVSTIMNLPLCIYFSSSESVCQNMNDLTLEACGFSSLREARGKTMHHVLTSASARKIEKNDSEIFSLQTIKIFEENSLRKDNVKTNVLSVKLPWYDSDDAIIGLMGCSVVLGTHSIATGLQEINEAGLFNIEKPSSIDSYIKSNKISLTQREMDCLELVMQGFSSKKIATKLGISHRTVENYLAIVKSKFHVTTKNELIDKIVG